MTADPEDESGRPASHAEIPAIKSRGTRRTVAGIAALVLAADQASKSLVVSRHPDGGAGGLVAVRLVRNTGASFGIGAGHPLLITLTAVAVLAVAMLMLARIRSRATALSLGAVAGGAAGNLADRLLRGPGPGRGAVVDWIHVAGYPATFNIADIAIRLGALCAVIAFFGTRPRPRQPRTVSRSRAVLSKVPCSRPCCR